MPHGRPDLGFIHTSVLFRLGLTNGLWSPMRGLARAHEAYYARLTTADLPRRNDLDGRGALSHEELVALAGFIAMTGLPARTVRRVLSSLHDHGLQKAESRVGRCRSPFHRARCAGCSHDSGLRRTIPRRRKPARELHRVTSLNHGCHPVTATFAEPFE
jgi:hypothetical protein